MAIPSFLKVKDDTVYYSGEKEFILYIPEMYFDRKAAVIEGEFVEVLGILNYAANVSSADEGVKKLRTFYLPTRFITKPGAIDKLKSFQITKNYNDDYRALHYTNNGKDQIIVSTKVPEDIVNVEDFFRIFVDTGHIPKTIPYQELYKYFLDSIEMSGNSYNLPASLFGVLTTELCRDPSDENRPFRLSKALDQDPCSYIPMSVKQIPKVVSPFTSLTSENFDNAVVGAITNTNNTPTPLEKVLTG